MPIMGWVKKKWNEWKRNELLYCAAEKGHLKEITELIKNGANINYKSSNGESLLSIAAKNGHLEITQELINAGVNVNSWNYFMYSNSPLTWAIGKDHLEITKKLITAGADLYQQNNCGDNALCIATKKWKKEVVDNLIELSLKQKTTKNENYKNDKATTQKTDFASLEEFLNTPINKLLEVGGMHSKYYNNPIFQKQYHNKWLKNTTDNNICKTEEKPVSTLDSEKNSSQLSNVNIPVSNKLPIVEQEKPVPTVKIFDKSKKQTINNENELVKNLPEVPTHSLEKQNKKIRTAGNLQ